MENSIQGKESSQSSETIRLGLAWLSLDGLGLDWIESCREEGGMRWNGME